MIKLIKMIIRENISPRNQPENHYWKLGYAKIYLWKICPFKPCFSPFWDKFFHGFPVWILKSRQVCWEEINMTTNIHFLQLILIWLWNINERHIWNLKFRGHAYQKVRSFFHLSLSVFYKDHKKERFLTKLYMELVSK